jgi:cytochrome c biogenesis factor
VVVIFFGVAGSAAYQKEAVAEVMPGDTLKIAGYDLLYEGYRLEAFDDHVGAVVEISVFQDGRPRGRLEAEQRLHPNMLFPELKGAFLRAKSLAAGEPAAYRAAVVNVYDTIRQLEATAGREVKTPSTEVGIEASLSPLHPSRFGEDLYVIPLWVDPASGRASLRAFVNPMVNFLWIGGLIFVIGAHLSVLPDARERKRLETAIALEERAVA